MSRLGICNAFEIKGLCPIKGDTVLTGVLFLQLRVGTGGVTTHLEHTLAALDRSVLEPHLICLRDDNYVERLTSLSERAKTSRVFRTNRAKFDPLVWLHLLFSIRRLILTEDIKLIHTYCWKTTTVGAVLSVLTGRPLVWTELNSDDLLSGYRGWVVRTITRRVACVRVNVHTRGRSLVEVGLPKEKLQYIPPGLPVEPFLSHYEDPDLRRELGLPRGAAIAMAIGRLTPEKGHGDLIEACAQLVHAGLDLHLVLVGEGPARVEFESLSQALCVSERVHFLGYRKDVPALLQQATVVVVPSHHENLSYVVLEAMAAGAPLVATRVGGIPEVIHDGENGLLVPPRAPGDLASAVSRLVDNPQLASQLAQLGRATILQGFTLTQEMASVQTMLVERAASSL